MLSKFATNFVSVNSFHLNGDQHGGKYSGFTYRPFTLEGNFAFAQGLHEMLLQSNNGYIEIFPAMPASWQNISFETLRTEGGFLVSAKKENGNVEEVTIKATVTGAMQLKLPFKTFFIAGGKRSYTTKDSILRLMMKKGESIVIKNGFE
jgi:alpha-L-fucosidase 2